MTSDLHHMAAAYALDALDETERQAFDAHLPNCEQCRIEVAEFHETALALADAVAVAPPERLRQGTLDAIRTVRQVSPMLPDPVVDLAERRRRRVARPILLAAMAAAVVAVVGFVGALQLRSDDPSVEDLVAAPDAVVTELDGGVDDAMVRVVWSPGRDQIAVVASDLPDPGEGNVYELWFLLPDEGGVAPAGLFDPEDGSVTTVLDVEDIDGIGWGVTIEPEGGSLEPTLPIVFQGTI